MRWTFMRWTFMHSILRWIFYMSRLWIIDSAIWMLNDRWSSVECDGRKGVSDWRR